MGGRATNHDVSEHKPVHEDGLRARYLSLTYSTDCGKPHGAGNAAARRPESGATPDTEWSLNGMTLWSFDRYRDSNRLKVRHGQARRRNVRYVVGKTSISVKGSSAWLPSRENRAFRLRRPCARRLAGCTSSGFAPEEVVVGNSSGSGEQQASRLLSGRVHFPFQPPRLARSGALVLPFASTSRAGGSSTLSSDRRQERPPSRPRWLTASTRVKWIARWLIYPDQQDILAVRLKHGCIRPLG